jgi:lipopolysaccharide/colanic/teichoic acid biosynthesis glycosyltransferase
MVKRLFDIVCSFIGLLILSPVFLLLALLIVFDSKGGVFYRQVRVGRNNRDFKLYKFRTMHTGADKKGLITVGAKDNRVTKVGYYLRKYKLDEFPQLLNVFLGDMSLVGPRPEVRKYVSMYNPEQLKVLTVKPGITDYASIDYSNENELLGKAADPEKMYVEEVMPAKLTLNLQYIHDQSLLTDIRIIFKTLLKIIS